MRQVLSDIRCFIGDSAQRDTIAEALVFKSVINNPQSAHSGVIVIDGETFTTLKMDKVNYAIIVSKHPFSLVLNEKVVLYTRHFSFANVHTVMNLSIYPRLRSQVEVRYLYGYVETGATESPVQIPEGCCQEEYDEILRNLVIDPSSCDFYPEWAQYTTDPDCCTSCNYDQAIDEIIFTCGGNPLDCDC